MVGQFFGVVARLRPHPAPLPNDIGAALTRRTFLMSVIGLVVFGLLLLNIGVLAIARMEPIPQVLDLPQYYLPGHQLPDDMLCDIITVTVPRCFVQFQGHVMYLDFDAERRMIIQVTIPSQQYSLGQLIVSWGMPTGIRWNNYTIYVYWQTRWVILDNNSLRPYSQVQSILYTLNQPLPPPWRGFRRG